MKQEIQLPLKEADFWNAFLSICHSLLRSEPVYGKAKIWVISQPANTHITNTPNKPFLPLSTPRHTELSEKKVDRNWYIFMKHCSSMQLSFQPQAQPSCTWSSSYPLETDLTRVKQISTVTIFPSTSSSNHRAATQCIDSLVSSGRNIWIYHIKHFIQLALSRCKTKQCQQAFRRKELWGKAKEAENSCRKLEQVNRRNVSTTQWCLFCVNTAVHRHFCVADMKGYFVKGGNNFWYSWGMPLKFWMAGYFSYTKWIKGIHETGWVLQEALKFWHEYVCSFLNVGMQIITAPWLYLEFDLVSKQCKFKCQRSLPYICFSSLLHLTSRHTLSTNLTFWKAISGFNLILNCAKLFNPLNLIFHQEFILSEARESTKFCVRSYQGDQYILSQISKSLQSLLH